MLRISVTEDHIKRGIAQNCHLCPVALALCDAGFDDVAVGPKVIRIGKEIVPTPIEVRIFVMNFDTHQNTIPMEFDLDTSSLHGNAGRCESSHSQRDWP